MRPKDIVPELLKKILKQLKGDYRADKRLIELIEKAENNEATYADAREFAQRLGDKIGFRLSENLTSENMPDGRIYYNIGERIVNGALKEPEQAIIDYVLKTQKALNAQANIGLAPQSAELNKKRLDGFIDKITDAPSADDVYEDLKSTCSTILQGMVDDSVDLNATLHNKAGLKAKIIRKAESGACKRCRGLAGEYSYPGVKGDRNVFWRHNNCNCLIEYHPGDGKVYDAHTKKQLSKQKSPQEVAEVAKRKKKSEEAEKEEPKKFYVSKQVDEFFKADTDAALSASKEVQEAISYYTSNDYEKISDALRKREDFMGKYKPEAREEIDRKVKLIKNFISKRNLQEDIVVYRAVDREPVENQIGPAKKAKGKEYFDEGFQSSSPLFGAAEDFVDDYDEKIIIEYHVPKGKGRGAFIDKISNFKEKEFEYLLQAGTKAKVKDVKNIYSLDIVVMEVLPDDE